MELVPVLEEAEPTSTPDLRPHLVYLLVQRQDT
jgi:hypothetical protein